MSSQFFGFDDDATVNTSCIQKPSPQAQKPVLKKVTPSSLETKQLTISEIQALLCQDLTTLDGSINSTVNDTSFYTDEETYPNTELTETVTEEFNENEPSIDGMIDRRRRKVLGNIENKAKKPVKTYKKPARTDNSISENRIEKSFIFHKKPITADSDDIENKTEKTGRTCKQFGKAGNGNVDKEMKTIKLTKKRKAKKENEENEENFDKFAEQINKQFAQVENFQLHVE